MPIYYLLIAVLSFPTAALAESLIKYNEYSNNEAAVSDYVDEDSISGPPQNRTYKTIMQVKFNHGGSMKLANLNEADCDAKVSIIRIGYISKDGSPLVEVPNSRNRVISHYPLPSKIMNDMFEFVCNHPGR